MSAFSPMTQMGKRVIPPLRNLVKDGNDWLGISPITLMGKILLKAVYLRLWLSLAQTYLCDRLIDTADQREKPDKTDWA